MSPKKTAPKTAPPKIATVTAVKPAGADHQVLTIAGGGGAWRRVPCPGCPWRVDNTGLFPAEAFRHSANTAYDMALAVFGCHESGPDKPATCAGFLLNGAAHNLSVRLKWSSGAIDPDALGDGGHALHPSYRAMAVANGVAAADPALARCRPYASEEDL